MNSHYRVVVIGGGVVGASVIITLPNLAGLMFACWNVLS